MKNNKKIIIISMVLMVLLMLIIAIFYNHEKYVFDDFLRVMETDFHIEIKREYIKTIDDVESRGFCHRLDCIKMTLTEPGKIYLEENLSKYMRYYFMSPDEEINGGHNVQEIVLPCINVSHVEIKSLKNFRHGELFVFDEERNEPSILIDFVYRDTGEIWFSISGP